MQSTQPRGEQLVFNGLGSFCKIQKIKIVKTLLGNKKILLQRVSYDSVSVFFAFYGWSEGQTKCLS